MTLRRDLALAARLPSDRWPQIARAVIELGLARLRLTSDHRQRLRDAPVATDPVLMTAAQTQQVDDVAYVIPRVAQRLPWRADCMVQALAAEHWLLRLGIASRLVIGAKKQAGVAPVEAHAWLEVGERVVTGGDVAGFSRFG